VCCSAVDRAGAEAEGRQGPFNIELFGGSPDDNNAYFFYNGAMSVLQPYIDSGKLVVASRQTGMDKVSTLPLDGARATRMDNLLSAFYATNGSTVLSPYDGLSIGILSSLKGVGYAAATCRCRSSAAGCGSSSIQIYAAREQYSTIFKRTPATRQGHRRHGGRGAERQDVTVTHHHLQKCVKVCRPICSSVVVIRPTGESPDRRRYYKKRRSTEAELSWRRSFSPWPGQKREARLRAGCPSHPRFSCGKSARR